MFGKMEIETGYLDGLITGLRWHELHTTLGAEKHLTSTKHRVCFFCSVQRRSDRMDGYWACACVHTSRRTEGEWRLWGLANLSVDF